MIKPITVIADGLSTLDISLTNDDSVYVTGTACIKQPVVNKYQNHDRW